MLDCIVTLTQRKEMLPPLREESIRLFYEYSRMDTYRAALEGMRRQADGSAGDMPPGKAPVPFFSMRPRLPSGNSRISTKPA